ncbi:hypothetical protein BDZ97DRAFT_353589 [Flammula alnicola]|nr:hypothetical protein BDZ97DRAFT_353589 [Flammula alnicola]
MKWIRRSEDRDAWIMWLNGAAGAGKSSIARSIAERCEQAKLANASFFFFRQDPTRNTAKPLAATLAYQLTISIPLTRKIIVEALDRDPLLFGRSFESQLKALIIEPLLQIRQQSDSSANLTSPFLIIIDGLDECDGRDVQTNIIHALSDALRDTGLPLVCLIASRPEQQITMAFNSRKVTDIVTRLPLDDIYRADKDIRLFLNDKFAEIKVSHPFKHLIGSSWPPEDVVDNIVGKSSGQFIYASVVINFVSSPRHHPVQRLEIVRGVRPARLDTPFAQLDALYMHIFSCVEDIDATMLILSYAILASCNKTITIERFLSLDKGDVEITLADLKSVIVVSSASIKFLHASLPDFLCDPGRAQKYYIDPPNRHADFAHLWFEHFKALTQSGSSGNTVVCFNAAKQMIKHLEVAVSTNKLQQDVLDFLPHPHYFSYSDTVKQMSRFLSCIRALDFQDEHRAYNQMLESVTRIAKDWYPDDYRSLAEYHNISQILDKLRIEPQTHQPQTQGLKSAEQCEVKGDGSETTAKKWPLHSVLKRVFRL